MADEKLIEPATYWESRCWINEQVLESVINLLAESHPELVPQLAGIWESWEKAISTIPTNSTEGHS